MSGEWFKDLKPSDIEFAGFELREANHDGTIMAQYRCGEK